MPPASSRSAATAGHAKSASSKKSVHIKSARKSIATDPALLQGSSDEDGEGPPDHENESSSLRDRPTHRNGSANTSTKTSSRTHKSTASVVASAPKSSPRRSTRLSGEGLETQQASGAASTSKDTRNGQKHFKDIATSSKESPTSVPSKRKALSSSNARNTVDSAQPTPPETDSDTASGRTGSTSQKKATNGSQSSTFHPKKLKSASGEPSQSKPRKAPSPPPSDQSDDSDNFAFTRVGQVPSASAPATSKPVGSQSTSQTAPPRITAPERIASSSLQGSQGSKTSKTKSAPTKKSGSHNPVSADLPLSLKEVRHVRPNKAFPTNESIPTSTKVAETVIDRKGKRKADESEGEEQDISIDSTTQRLKSSQPTKLVSANKPKKGRVAELSREDQEDSQPSQPPDPGTPGRSSSSTNVSINIQETPAIQRNLAMRAGLGHGLPPGTPGSARRSSGDMRGRRGSSIGNGLEALPHPSLPSTTLYRHIKADDPPAVRFRTLVTWSAHRLKEASEAQSRTAPTDVRAAVSAVMDNLIADLVEKRINLSWQAADPTEDTSKKDLPPNPQNEANQAKLESCQAWIQRLHEEDKARNARINQYKTMTERITKLMTPLPPLPASTPASTSTSDIPDLLQPNWSLPLPRFKDRSDMLAYGRKLLQPKPSTVSTRRKSAAATETDKDQDPNVINVQSEYPIDFDEIRHQASSLAQNSYRVNQFLNLADTFVKQHLAKTQATLAQITSGTRGDHALGIGSSGAGQKGKNRHDDEQSTTRALLEGVSGSPNQVKKRGMDAMSLLRAISKADTSKKR